MKNADMPAMPAGKITVPAPNGGDPFGNYTKEAIGLTKRELIAAMAMQGLLSSMNVEQLGQAMRSGVGADPMEIVSKAAVNYADALLAELEE